MLRRNIPHWSWAERFPGIGKAVFPRPKVGIGCCLWGFLRQSSTQDHFANLHQLSWKNTESRRGTAKFSKLHWAAAPIHYRWTSTLPKLELWQHGLKYLLQDLFPMAKTWKSRTRCGKMYGNVRTWFLARICWRSVEFPLRMVKSLSWGFAVQNHRWWQFARTRADLQWYAHGGAL